MNDQRLDCIYSYIISSNTRLTEHTKDILAVLLSAKSPLEAKVIYQVLVSKKIKIDLSTTHRLLKKLSELQVLSSVFKDKATAYELSTKFNPHHHHFTCLSCNQIIDLNLCALDKLNLEAEAIGQILAHRFELQGICQTCSRK